MNRLKKGLSAVLICLMILSLCNVPAFAAGKIDVAKDVSLTISYIDVDKAVANAQFDIYRVANVTEYCEFVLTDEFAPFKDKISGLGKLSELNQNEWNELASTLKGYVQRDSIAAVDSGITGADGKITFPSVKPALYLVIGSRVTDKDFVTYSTSPFMICLPALDSENNTWVYETTAYPKFTKDTNPPDGEKVTRKVLKIWNDDGHENQRPASITVDLLCDGKVFDSQILTPENGWKYAWDNLESGHDWGIVEKIPENYQISIDKVGVTYTLTNTYVSPESKGGLQVVKKLAGDKPQSASQFEFILKSTDASFPMPAGSNGTEKTIFIKGAGSADFGEISFTKPGTYVYTVTEKDTGVKGYVYDAEIFTASYTVTEKDGQMSAELNLTDSKGVTVSKAVFTNSYGKVPQTGVLWWPVPILLILGIALVAAGVIRKKKCN